MAGEKQSNLKKTAASIEGVVDSATLKLLEGAQKTQTTTFRGVLVLIKKLDLNPTGTIKQTAKNMKVLNEIRRVVENLVINKAYEKRVGSFVGEFEAIEKLNKNYYTTLAAAFNPSKAVFKQILKNQQQLTINSLLESGINANIVEPIKNIIQQNVTAGGNFDDLVTQLREEIKGVEAVTGKLGKISKTGKLGSLERYSGQIATDSLNQYSANYGQAVTADLGLEWVWYSGGKKRTSRSYCKKRAGKYFHVKEMEDSASLSWSGKIPGTDASNIFTKRGGYNCQHLYVGTDTEVVPKKVIDRNVANGNYTP